MGLYHNFHAQLRRSRGKASEHACSVIECPLPAVEWAWDLTGEHVEEELRSFGRIRLVRFSLDPDRYRPMCKPHHVSLDRGGMSETLPCGHPNDAENTYRRPGGSRYCRTCHREGARRGRRSDRTPAH